jgi:3-oxoacyl-[acyl-carrier-protein] synthase-1
MEERTRTVTAAASSGLAVTAWGMVTSVGFNGRSSCAAMRAGIRNVVEANLWDATTGTYLSAGKVSLPQWWVGTGKLAELVTPAIRECLDAVSVPPDEIPILLGVCSRSRPGRFERLEEEILQEIEHRLDIHLHPSSCVIPRDRVSVVVGLREAGALFTERKASHCVVAAVDSLIEQEVVDHLLAQDRLITEMNPNGFFVGEAGSAVLVTSDETGPRDALRILGMGLGLEAATVDSEEPLRAAGLIEAMGAALKDSGMSLDELHYRITDLNGEHYRFKEMVLAMLRYERKPKPKLFDLWHPIEYIGDVGTAISPVVLGVALDASRRRYGIGPRVLCTFGNDDGERAALVVEHQLGARRS